MSAIGESSRSDLHVGERRANRRVCPFCSKSFTKAEHLSRHVRVHTKERPFRCSDCGKHYSRRDTLLRHRKVHEDPTHNQDSPSTRRRTSTATSSPCRTDEVAAATLVDLQSSADFESFERPSSSRQTTSTTAADVEHGSLGTLSTPMGLELFMLPNANHGASADYGRNLIQDPSNSRPLQTMPEVDFEFSPPIGGAWGSNQELFGACQISDDFDLDAFNASLLLPVFVDQSAWHMQPALQNGQSPSESNEETQMLTAPSMDEIQSLWITKMEENLCNNDANASYSVCPTRPMTPTTDGSSATTVDDSYRNDLSLRMRPRWKEHPLPSTEFLNSALRLFFKRFNPVFPILHEPTFHASNHNSLLLLSVCSIGSLFMGSSAATAQGSRIFERLNKVILASWEKIVSKNTPERLYLVQAAVIGQTFAYLSGVPKYLATVEAFHGTVITFARRCGLFTTNHTIPDVDGQTPQELEKLWTSWARSEEMIRTVLGLYVHDAQFASTFHHDPTLRHNVIRIPAAANDDLFAAPTALQWAAIIRQSSISQVKLGAYVHLVHPPHARNRPLVSELGCSSSRFSCYVLLHGIGAAIEENNAAGQLSPADRAKYTDALLCWYHAYEKSRPLNESDPFSLMVLYHELFMQLLVDFDQLERAIGRDGAEEATQPLQYARDWLSTIEAKRCIIHASLICRLVGAVRIDAEPALHVPRAMFLAALVWYFYTCYSQPEHDPSRDSSSVSDILEVHLFNINTFQFPIESNMLKGIKPSSMEGSPLMSLVDMLSRIGHWGISHRFARILKLLVDRERHFM